MGRFNTGTNDFTKGKTGTVIRFGERKNHLTNGPKKGLKLFSAENAAEEVDLFTIQKKDGVIIKKGLSDADGTMRGNIIPDTDNSYDIGSASYKIRDMFISDDSLWIGDDHKIDIVGGKMKFKKRDTSVVPETITAAGGSGAAALTHAGKQLYTEMNLGDWIAYGKTQNIGGAVGNATAANVFPSGTAANWEEDDEQLTAAERTKLSGIETSADVTDKANVVSALALLTGTETLTIGDSSGVNTKVVIKGKLQVDGTTTTINSTTLDVDDKNITIAKGATAALADGAGITVDGAGATMLYNSTGDQWEFNKEVNCTAGFIGDITGALTGNSATATKIASITNSNIVQLTATQTLTGKTLTSPTLTTPVLGTPASGNLASCTFPTLNQSTSGTAAVATNITVADESTDTSCRVVFVTDATGDRLPKTGSNLTFDSADGVLTATNFVGGGSGLTGFGHIDNGTSNITSGGIWKVDVDTAETGAGLAGAAGTFNLGASNDLNLYHDGDNSWIVHNNTGDLTVKTNSGGIRLDAADNTLEIIYSGNIGATFGTSGLNLTPGDYYSINAASVLNATTLGTLVVNSSLTSVGALGGGSISSGFGHIDNGTSNITSGGIWKVNIDSAVTPDPTTTGINAAGSITLGVGNDAGLYVQGDDLYVENKTSNKDIIFRINAGSTYTTAMTINGDAANVIISTGIVPDAQDGAYLGTDLLQFSDLFLADEAVISFGNNNEITLTHVHDKGLTLKHTATAANKPIALTLATGETDIEANDVIGTINFQAPDEGETGDSRLVCAGIEAVSEGDFASDNNATKLSFKTGASGAASEKMSLSSGGDLTVSGDLYVDKIRRKTDSGATTKILLNNEVIKLYAGHSSNVIATIDTTGLKIDNGSLETATIDYTDGDNAMTIANGGKVTFAAGFDVGSDAEGDILYHNGTNYVRLGKSSNGKVLTLASNVPSWADASGGASALNDLSDVTYANGDLGITGLDTLKFGNGGNANVSVLATAHNVAGKELTITAGTTTAATTDDVAGGNITIQGGQGKGSGVGGNIIFQVATAGSSGSTLNSYISPLTISSTGTTTATSLVATTSDINGGTIDGTVIGGVSAAAGTFDAIVGTSLSLGEGTITNVGDINCDQISIDNSLIGLNIDFGGVTTKNLITLTDNLADALNITQSTNSYLKFVTTNGGERIVFGKDSTFNGTTIVDLGTVTTANIDGGTIDGTIIGGESAAAGTFDAIVGTSLSLGEGTITNVGDINCDSISIDTASIGLNINFGGVTTKNLITLTDHLPDALNITQSTNSYLKFVTTNGGERIVFGKDSTFNGTTIVDLGTVTTANIDGGTIDGTIIGGESAAAGTFDAIVGTSLSLGEGTITNVGDINCDQISIDNSSIGLNIDFGGVTTKNLITLTDHLPDALNITQSTNSYLKFVTTNGGEQIVFGKDSIFNGDTTSTSSISEKPLVMLNATNSTAGTSGELQFRKNPTGADGAQLGKISFFGRNNLNQLAEYGDITSTIADKIDGAEKGTMELKVATFNGTPTTGLVIQGTSVNGRVDVYLGGGGTSYTNSRGPFSTTGTITATLDITAFTSDKRLKKDIVIIENPLEKLQKLSGFTYHWNKEKCKEAGFKPKDEGQIGVFAQDVQEVIPEAVKIAPFDRDENGESKSGDNYLTVQYEKLIPLLIESNKALLKRVEELEELVTNKIN